MKTVTILHASMTHPDNLDISGDAAHSIQITGSHLVIQIGLAAAQARSAGRDPAQMLRVAALLAAPVFDPRRPDRPPAPLDLRAEWERLARAISDARTPILLARLVPPTLATLRRELSPRAADQGLFPHVLHVGGHAWAQGLLLEDEYGRTHYVTAAELLREIRPPRPLDLVVLNACETAAEAQSAAQALIDAGLARAVVGHPQRVLDSQAIAFTRALYADLTDGYSLREAVDRAQRSVTTHTVMLLGDGDLRFSGLARGEALIHDARPVGNLPPGAGVGFVGRGAELVDIAQRLDQPPGVIVIFGPPGIGKSRLALEAAHRNAWRFPGGVVYAEAWRREGRGEGQEGRGERSERREERGERSERQEERGKRSEVGGEGSEVVPFPGSRADADAGSAGAARAVDLLNLLADALRLPGLTDGSAAQPGSAGAFALPLHERVSAALLGYAHTRATLFVLDNLETLPPPELDALGAFLGRLGGQSAAILTLRPATETLEELPHSRALPLHDGLHEDDAIRYALDVARSKGVRLNDHDAAEIARAAAGHPLLITQIVARARRRDRQALLAEVRAHAGDFAAQVEAVYAWSAARIGAAGARAWSALPLFPAGWVPEAILRALAGADGAEALRGAAVADFDPERQGWRWHPTAADYAARRWRLSDDERTQRHAALLPAWTDWLAQMVGDAQAHARLEAALPNLAPLIDAARHASEGWAFLQQLDRVLPAPDRTLALRAIQEPLYQAMAELAPDDAGRAWALHMLGYACSALGRREDALAAAEEAVALYRELAAAQPDAFRPDLAGSLSNLGVRLAEVGRHAEALAAAEEAVALYQELAAAQPDAFRPDLARSLVNLGVRLATAGHREEALAAAEKAVALCRALAAEAPDAFRPDLATSLANLGVRLAAVGRKKEALTAVEEAVAIRRALAATQPEAFRPDLARSLANLGNRLASVGRKKEALAAVEEAVAIRRKLVAVQPEAFRPDLARSLANLGIRLAGVGRHTEALAAVEEAVAIRRKLAAMQPQVFLPELARSLVNLSNRLAAAGRKKDALAVREEAATFYRTLAARQPEKFRPKLARILSKLGKWLAEEGQRKEALIVSREVVDLYQALAATQPEKFHSKLAASLSQLEKLLNEDGQ